MKDEVTRAYDHLAHIAKTLGNALRIRLIEYLAQGEKTVDDLTALVRLPVANVSHHLQVLHQEGMVRRRREGSWIKYSLTGNEVILLLYGLRSFGFSVRRDLVELARHLPGEPGDHVPISREDAVTLLRDGKITLLDVRRRDEFVSGHVEGAVNIPLDELPSRMTELQPGQEIVVYCRGPFCLLSSTAVSLLIRSGHSARRLEDGYPEWLALGLPVEDGQEALSDT